MAATKPRTGRSSAKSSDPLLELLDVLADVVAARVAAKIIETPKPPSGPQRVPLWLLPDSRPRRAKGSPVVGPWTPEKSLRSIGAITVGDPGYDEAVKRYIAGKTAHDAELAARADLRRAARLLRKLVDRSAPGAGPAR